MLSGIPGGPYWSSVYCTLNELLNNLDHEAVAAIQDVYSIEICICEEDAEELREAWKKLMNAPGTYRLTETQCTTTVRDALRAALGDRIPKSRRLRPISFLKELKKAEHDCGENKAKKVKIKQVHAEPRF